MILNQIAEMLDQSRNEFERIAKIRRIKNYEEMSKEELIISILKSKPIIAELFNNNLNDDKISDVKGILNRLRDILPKRYRKEIKKKASQYRKKEKSFRIRKGRKLVRILSKKEEHGYNDRDDLDNYGIRDIENLFNKVDEEDY